MTESLVSRSRRPWRRRPAGPHDELRAFVEEAEKRVARGWRADRDEEALWYCGWNDRVAEWLGRYAGPALRNRFYDLELEEAGAALLHAKIAFLRGLDTPPGDAA